MRTTILETQPSGVQRSTPCPAPISAAKTNPEPIETLDHLFELARDFADHFTRHTNDPVPGLFLTGPQGAYMPMPQDFAALGEQYGYDRTAQLMCLAHGATACVVVLGVWWDPEPADPNPDDPSSLTTASKREESIMLFGQDRSGIHICFHSVIRSDNGRFFGLGEPILADNGQSNGFPPVLSSVPPTTQQCQRAQEILRAKGAELIPLIPNNTP